MKTLMLLGLVLLCGQFPQSLTAEEEERTGLVSEVVKGLQSVLNYVPTELNKLDLVKYTEKIQKVKILLDSLKTLFGTDITSLHIENAKILKISLQENKDKQSVSVTVPLDFSLGLKLFFQTIGISVNANTTLELTTAKDEDGQSRIVVSKCYASHNLLNISSTGLAGRLLKTLSGTVSDVAEAAVNEIVCPLLKAALELVPSAVVDALQELVHGNATVSL